MISHSINHKSGTSARIYKDNKSSTIPSESNVSTPTQRLIGRGEIQDLKIDPRFKIKNDYLACPNCDKRISKVGYELGNFSAVCRELHRVAQHYELFGRVLWRGA